MQKRYKKSLFVISIARSRYLKSRPRDIENGQINAADNFDASQFSQIGFELRA